MDKGILAKYIRKMCESFESVLNEYSYDEIFENMEIALDEEDPVIENIEEFKEALRYMLALGAEVQTRIKPDSYAMKICTLSWGECTKDNCDECETAKVATMNMLLNNA